MIILFTFFAVMAVSIVLFAFWTLVSIFKLIARLIGWTVRSATSNTLDRHCLNPGCRTTNPLHARFCRRCGCGLVDTAANPRPRMPQPRYNPQNGRGRQVASI